MFISFHFFWFSPLRRTNLCIHTSTYIKKIQESEKKTEKNNKTEKLSRRSMKYDGVYICAQQSIKMIFVVGFSLALRVCCYYHYYLLSIHSSTRWMSREWNGRSEWREKTERERRKGKQSAAYLSLLICWLVSRAVSCFMRIKRTQWIETIEPNFENYRVVLLVFGLDCRWSVAHAVQHFGSGLDVASRVCLL